MHFSSPGLFANRMFCKFTSVSRNSCVLYFDGFLVEYQVVWCEWLRSPLPGVPCQKQMRGFSNSGSRTPFPSVPVHSLETQRKRRSHARPLRVTQRPFSFVPIFLAPGTEGKVVKHVEAIVIQDPKVVFLLHIL